MDTIEPPKITFLEWLGMTVSSSLLLNTCLFYKRTICPPKLELTRSFFGSPRRSTEIWGSRMITWFSQPSVVIGGLKSTDNSFPLVNFPIMLTLTSCRSLGSTGGSKQIQKYVWGRDAVRCTEKITALTGRRPGGSCWLCHLPVQFATWTQVPPTMSSF